MRKDTNYENFLVTRPLWAFFGKDKYGIPKMWKPKLTMEKAAYSDLLNMRNLSTKVNIENRIVENFAYDSQLETLWKNPFSKLKRLRKALAVMTPDFSITPSMQEAQVINNTFRNRWMGCFYQQESIDVIPCVSWAEDWTFDICVQGIEKKSPIAVSTLGVKDIRMFLDGYHYFLEKIQPDYILCYGKRIKGMTGNIISFSYEDAFMPNRYGQQLRLFEVSRLSVIKKEDE